jgi:hypothetical protein
MKQKRLRSVRQMLSVADGLPIGEKERIEISKTGERRSVLIEGVRRILLYGAEEMVFLMGKELLSIRGKELDCVTYVSGAMGIVGEIDTISFSKETE